MIHLARIELATCQLHGCSIRKVGAFPYMCYTPSSQAHRNTLCICCYVHGNPDHGRSRCIRELLYNTEHIHHHQTPSNLSTIRETSSLFLLHPSPLKATCRSERVRYHSDTTPISGGVQVGGGGVQVGGGGVQVGGGGVQVGVVEFRLGRWSSGRNQVDSRSVKVFPSTLPPSRPQGSDADPRTTRRFF